MNYLDTVDAIHAADEMTPFPCVTGGSTVASAAIMAAALASIDPTRDEAIAFARDVADAIQGKAANIHLTIAGVAVSATLVEPNVFDGFQRTRYRIVRDRS